METANVSRYRYIHYGTDKFDPARLNGYLKNGNCPRKPVGAVIWASPAETDDWLIWCGAEEFREGSFSKSFTFTLRDPSKIIFIRNEQDLLHAIDRFSIPDSELDDYWRDVKETEGKVLAWDPIWGGPIICLDFVKMQEEGYDGIHIDAGSEYCLYWAFYGWDVNSIAIWNPDQIVVERCYNDDI